MTDYLELPSAGSWTFKNKAIAEGFDNHVREQLPWYDMVTRGIAHIAMHYIPQNGVVYDLGASTGNVGRAISETLKTRNVSFTPIEESPDMVANYSGPGKPVCQSFKDFEFEPFDLAVCNLALMFQSHEVRGNVIARLINARKRGGAIVIVEKFTGSAGYTATVMYRLALAEKMRSGAEPSDILTKELSLAGRQVPLSADEITGAIEWFRFGDFAGYLITDDTQDIGSSNG